jgi:hypothetical protein
LYWNGGAIYFNMHDGTHSVTAHAYLSPNLFYDLLFYAAPSEASEYGSHFFTNGSPTGGGFDFSTIGNTDGTAPLTVGGLSTNDYHFGGNLVYAAMWHAPAWIPAGVAGYNEMAAVAAAQSALLPASALA